MTALPVIAAAGFALGAAQVEPPRVARLPCGLSVVVIEDRAAPAVAVQVWYRAGSALDHPQQAGLCHVARTLLEHRDEAALRLRALGARFESFTLRDAVCFASIAPRETLEEVLTIEAARMRPLDVAPADVERTLRRAARAPGAGPREITLRATNAPRSAVGADGADLPPAAGADDDDLLAAALAGHPYARLPQRVAISPPDLQPRDLNDFLNRWFVPGNATLLIAGDVRAGPTVELARRLFAPLPWSEPPRADEPQRPEKVEVRRETRAATGGVDFAWLVPGWAHAEAARLDLLMHGLCSDVDGPLAARLREAGLGPPRFARFAWRRAGLLTLSVDAPHTRLADAEAIVRRTLLDAAAAPLDPVQLDRAATAARAELLRRRATFRGRALEWAAHEVIGGDAQLAEHEAWQIERVGVEELRAAARLLGEVRRVARWRLPAGDGREADRAAPPVEAGIETAAEALDLGQALELLARHAAGSPEPALGAGRAPPEPVDQAKPVVRLRRAAGAPLVRVRTTVVAPQSDPPVACHALPVPAVLGPERLTDYLSYHGITLSPYWDGLRCGADAVGPPDRLAQMLELHAELIRRPDRSAPATQTAAAGPIPTPASSAARRAMLADRLALLAAARGSVSAAQIGIDPSGADASGGDPDAVAALIEVWGDVEPDAVRSAVDAAWSAADGATRPASTPERPPAANAGDARAAHDSPAPRSSAATPDAPPRRGSTPPAAAVEILWAPLPGEPAELRVVFEADGQDEAGASALEPDAAAWLFGPPCASGTELDGERRWRWTCRVLAGATLAVSTARPAAAAAPELREILSRVAAVRSGAVEAGQIAMARRLAAAARITTADEEWNQLPELATADTPAHGARERRIRVIVVGGDETAGRELSGLGVVTRFAGAHGPGGR